MLAKLKLNILIAAIVVFMLCAVVLGQEEPQEVGPTEEEIKALIAALAADSWKERAEAQAKLTAAGEAAGPLLEEAAKSDDPEVAHRAKKILDEICYLPDKLRAEVDALYEKLKSRDTKEQDEAFKKLISMGKRVMSYLGRLLKTPSDNKVEMTLTTRRGYTEKRQPVDYTFTIKNAGEKPVWVPGPGISESGSYLLFGSGESQINWSRGFGRSRGAFGFVHLAPGESIEHKKSFRPYGGYSGRHKLQARLARTEGVQYTTPKGEQGFLPVAHYSPKKDAAAEVVHIPELVEGKEGRKNLQLVAGLKAARAGIEKGAALPVKFSIRNAGKEAKKISSRLHQYAWYILVPVGDKTKVAAEGLLLGETPQPSEDYTIELGKSLEFDVEIKPEVKTGEYYLVCGYTDIKARGEGLFRGEIVSNAVKINVKPAKKEEEEK